MGGCAWSTQISAPGTPEQRPECLPQQCFLVIAAAAAREARARLTGSGGASLAVLGRTEKCIAERYARRTDQAMASKRCATGRGPSRESMAGAPAPDNRPDGIAAFGCGWEFDTGAGSKAARQKFGE